MEFFWAHVGFYVPLNGEKFSFRRPFLRLRELWSNVYVEPLSTLRERMKGPEFEGIDLGVQAGFAVLEVTKLKDHLDCAEVRAVEETCLKDLDATGVFANLPLPLCRSVFAFEEYELPNAKDCSVDLLFCGGGDRELARRAGLECVDALERAGIVRAEAWELRELAASSSMSLSIHRTIHLTKHATGYTYLRDGGWAKREDPEVND